MCARLGKPTTIILNDLGWIRREYNVSDSLTKIEVNAAMLKFITTGQIDFVVEQFVVRMTNVPNDSGEN